MEQGGAEVLVAMRQCWSSAALPCASLSTNWCTHSGSSRASEFARLGVAAPPFSSKRVNALENRHGHIEPKSQRETLVDRRRGSSFQLGWLIKTLAVLFLHNHRNFCAYSKHLHHGEVEQSLNCFSANNYGGGGDLCFSKMYWDDHVDVIDIEALWSHPLVQAQWLKAGELPGRKVRMSTNSAGQSHVTDAEMRALTEITISRHFTGLDPVMICAIADVESSRLPLAYRYEISVQEASTGLMQTLQSTAEWLARDMGYRFYGANHQLQSLYRPFVSVYFGAAYVKWLSTYAGKSRSEEFIVRGYNGGPNGVTSQSTAYYWRKYCLAKQRWARVFSARPAVAAVPVPTSAMIQPSTLDVGDKDGVVPEPVREWTYWDEKSCREDLDELWKHSEVRQEWEKAGEVRGKVRFSRDSTLQPYLTKSELKAVASIISKRHLPHTGVDPAMLCRIAEITSNRRLYGPGSTIGIMRITFKTASWLFRDMGFSWYELEHPEDLSQPFVSMYFGAAYVSWLSKYEGREQSDEFIVRAYHGGPQGADKPETHSFWLKYIGIQVGDASG